MKFERQQFKGRQIEVRDGKDGPELRIDDVPMRYGRLPDGKYFLDDYAYDWADDLVELARRYIAYRERVAVVQAATKPPRKEA
jgi:hypothetical protein